MDTQFVTSLVHEKESFQAGKLAAQEALKKQQRQMKPDLAILFDSPLYDHEAVMRGIKSITGEDILIIGCTSAGQFNEEEVTKDGMCCAFISSQTHRFFSGIGTNLKTHPLHSIENATTSFPKDTQGYPHQSAILFVDGLAGKGEEAVLAASSVLGSHVNFAGGAAADHLNFRETAVFGNNEALTDAISICLIASKKPVMISIKHGHKPISPPLKVTKAEGNILYEIEGKPAWEIWKTYLKEKLKKEGIEIDQLSPDDCSKVLLKYEAGLMTGKEYKIRFPISCNANGSFNFVCPILEGSVIKIMDSESHDQIESARQAAEAVLKAANHLPLAGAVIFDCACRAMILKDQFSQAIQATQHVLGSIPFIGCETYGEIAMNQGQLSGFHNTSTVIMLFPS
jgi:methyl-accepting chemotaxis protein